MAYRLDALIAVQGQVQWEVVDQEVQEEGALQQAFAQHNAPGAGLWPPCPDWAQIRCYSWRMQAGRKALAAASTQEELRKEAEEMKAWRLLMKQLHDSCSQAMKDVRSICKAFESAKRQETTRLERQRLAAEKKAAKEKQSKDTRIGAGRASRASTGSGTGRNEHFRFFDDKVIAQLKKVPECGLETFRANQIANVDLTLPYVVRKVVKFTRGSG